MATLPRESKYRHIFHETATNTNCYTDINPDVFGDSQHIATNGKYWAVPIQAGGGGSFMVHNLEDTGRIQREHPLFKYHTARILELSFSKFNDNIIASSSDDCSVRVCNFPEEMTDNIMKEDVLLNGHSKKVTDLSWHNTANNVLASSSADKKVIIWDVEVGEEAIVIEDHEDLVYSIVWNDNGRYFGSSCQDRLIRILDPRDENASVLSTIGHENKKMSRVFWLNNRNMIGSVGFTKDSYRELAFFDLRKIEEAFLKKRLDRQTSKFFPYFEEGNDILFLSGKGDCGIRAFELSEQEGFCHFVTELKMMHPQKGVAVIPRRRLDTSKCEIFKALRLKSSSIEPVSIMVPRRNSVNVFQEDIYPDCISGKPAISIDEYFDGVNKKPLMMSMNTKSDEKASSRIKRRQVRKSKENSPKKEKPKPLTKKPETKKLEKSEAPNKLEKRNVALKVRKQAEKTNPQIAVNKKDDEEIKKLKEQLKLLKKVESDLIKEVELEKAKTKKAEREAAELRSDMTKRIEQIADLEMKLGNIGDGNEEELKIELEKQHKRARKARKKAKNLEKELRHSEEIINKQAENIKSLFKRISELGG